MKQDQWINNGREEPPPLLVIKVGELDGDLLKEQ